MNPFKMLRAVPSMLMVICLAFYFTACEGPEGPQGLAGADGADGAAGATGATGAQGEKGDKGDPGDPGAAGTAGCITCHDMSTDLVARVDQWSNSQHNMGGNFERNSADCAPCHTHEGFREFQATGAVAATISNPTAIGCRTCHNIHTSYERSDFTLAVTGATPFRAAYLAGETYDKGASNLCVACHQPRDVTLPTVGGGDYTVTSSRFGPHHGPQGSLLAGIGGYEVPGTLAYNNTAHTTMISNGCVTCHMQEAFGRQSGGHTMKMEYEYHGVTEMNTAGCQSCHDGIEDFDVNGAVTDLAALGAQLETMLINDGLLTASGSAVAGTYSANKAGALFNYRMIFIEDRSGGVHNPKYAKALIQNSIDAYNN